jgi:oxygen-independent coproporphyrinogen-3 oxidase
MPLGIYISVPFCRSKCTFCNFVSGVFSREKMQRYVDRLRQDIENAGALTRDLGAMLYREADSVYLGGGTPSTLSSDQLRQIFGAVRNNFELQPDSEITVECAPGTLSAEIIDALVRCGVNRVSLGVQSFIDTEAAAVGRLHTRAQTLADIDHLRAAGIEDINLDLIAGLPHQTAASWGESLQQVIDTGVPHVSVYVLEIDEDSRLGRELIAGGTKYHAHHVPNADLAADLYLEGIAFLERHGVRQYEISNFARLGCESKHNLKYWTRQPYIGFGLDAHSMLPVKVSRADAPVALRLATTDDLEHFLVGPQNSEIISVSKTNALEEAMFLGLRLNAGIDLSEIEQQTGLDPAREFGNEIKELLQLGLLERSGARLRLTPRGRLLSNEVFERFLLNEIAPSTNAVSS